MVYIHIYMQVYILFVQMVKICKDHTLGRFVHIIHLHRSRETCEPQKTVPLRRFLLPFAAEYTEGNEKEIRPWLVRDILPLNVTCFMEESEGGWME